jgi:hypothetical protein
MIVDKKRSLLLDRATMDMLQDSQPNHATHPQKDGDGMVIEATAPIATRALNIRDVPLDLYTPLKVLAAASNMGIRDYVVSVLQAHVQQRAQSGGVTLIFTGTPAAPASPAQPEASTPTA